MRQSKLYLPVKREFPKDEVSTNAKWLIRAGFLEKEMAGVYSYLPLGVRVLQKIEQIIREEMVALGGQEILMSALHPRNLWEKTDRWHTYDVLYKVKAQDGGELVLGPTHEEIVTDLVARRSWSYKDLPFALFQIQTKFRDEPRAKSGLLRGREFVMKDLYSFHADEDDLERFYKKAIPAYKKIFARCGLDAFLVEGSGGAFTKRLSHEFMVETPAGEDITFTCNTCDFAKNREIALEMREGIPCPSCKKGAISSLKTVEAGNIFKLGTKFSEPLKAYFLDKDGAQKPMVMGCYGLGPSRVMGTIVEVHHDERGMRWPESVAPYRVHLLKIQNPKSKIQSRIQKESDALYEILQKKDVEVLYDDRDGKSAGEKFMESDLIGLPWRVVVSERTITQKKFELKNRKDAKPKLVTQSQLFKLLLR